MAVKPILLLGDPRLYQVSRAYARDDLPQVEAAVADLHDTMTAFRAHYGFGRAIAAPQIGEFRRLIYMNIDRPVVIINPMLTEASDQKMLVWDNCMSFPDLLVKVQRHQRCALTFRDLDWQEQTLRLDGDLSELLQHEYDHLDGILATQRALDSRAFALAASRGHLK